MAEPVFHVAYGLDTSNGPLTDSLFQSSPADLGETATVTSPFYARQVQVQAQAERGRIRLMNSVRTTGPYAIARPEALASFQADVFLCDSSSPVNANVRNRTFDADSCMAPGNLDALSIVPYPNISLSGTGSASQGALAAFSVTATVNGTTVGTGGSTFNTSIGDAAGTLGGIVAPLVTGVGSPFTNNVMSVKVNAATITGCNNIGRVIPCQAMVDLSHTIEFVDTGDVFEGLLPNMTVWSPDLNIFDNRWYSPEFYANPPQAPEPPAVALFLLGLTGLAVMGRRRQRATVRFRRR
ncbi:MAG: DUF4150 domain-containing protein [Rhodobacterales bacterium]|nr:DUF4150 domain-containing protein [Rhodobacterales bacterium]